MTERPAGPPAARRCPPALAYHPPGRRASPWRCVYTEFVVARRLCLPLLLFALLAALVPCAPASAHGACGMRRGCPMQAAHGGCKSENSTAFDCCKMRGDRAPASNTSASPALPLADAPAVAARTPVVAPTRPDRSSARRCAGVERFTLYGAFLI